VGAWGFDVDVGARIRSFISEEIMFENDSTVLTNDTPLLSGVMDSLGLLQLVSFLEEEFDVEIEASEITADHFGNVGSIVALLRQKVRAG
jgi:acyl carrier protein